MPRALTTFDVDAQPEVFSSSAATSTAVLRAVKAGRARRIARSLFTRNVVDPLAQVVERNWSAVAAHYVPGGVLVDRSAIDARPSRDGSLFLDAGPDYKQGRTHRVEGLWIRPRPGPGPLAGDMPHMDGLFFSGRARALLDNMRVSRARVGVARTLSGAEMEHHLAHVAAVRGSEELNRLRDEARELARLTGEEPAFVMLDDLIGAMQGTRNRTLATPGGRAAARGEAYDVRRVELFEVLQAALLGATFASRPEQQGSWTSLAFIEAYFSNWIEGTEFELAEAEGIVFQRAVPAGRFEDAHDVLGTFDLVNDAARRRQVPTNADDLLAILRSHHASVLERRPAAEPGRFKERVNRAGATTFVHPDQVVGTLRAGHRFMRAIPEGLARAIFVQFLVSEVHPFTDGNGRMARIMMNAELTAAGEQRVIVPIVYRDDYLQSLRALSRNGDPAPLIRVLDFAQHYASLVNWSALSGAEDTLRATNAFLEPDEARDRGVRLTLPG